MKDAISLLTVPFFLLKIFKIDFTHHPEVVGDFFCKGPKVSAWQTDEVKMKKNDEIELDIADTGNEGEGIGRYDGMPFFVKGAVVGDRILAGVTKLKKTYGYARLVKVITPSPFRVIPPCPIAGKCGGCQLQSIAYEKQLEIKESKVYNDLVRLGKISADRLINPEDVFSGKDPKEIPDSRLTDEKTVYFHKIIGMSDTCHYRNKGQFPVGLDKEGRVVTGFYAGHTHSIIPTEKCMIQHELTDGIMETVRAFMEKYGISAYVECGGTVRHILTRVGFRTHEVMVCVVINGQSLPHWQELKDMLEACVENYNTQMAEDNKSIPGFRLDGDDTSNIKYRLASFSVNINTENTNVILGDKVKTLYGDPYITDYIGDLKYRISPLSFYQVNPVQTLKLYHTALKYAVKPLRYVEDSSEKDLTDSFTEDISGKTVWDLYCGIGTISLFMARKAKKVYGVEIVPQAIEDAKKNAEINGITNAEFICGAAEEVMPAKFAEDPELRTDVIVVDPPRKGCDEKLLATIVKMEPERIVYVSCDPATLSRDVAYLEDQGYILKEVQPVDQFPYSSHVETVCWLKKDHR